MTLLAYMSKADFPPPECGAMPDLMNTIGQRFPNALLMPVTTLPPRTTRPWAQQDWLTVPKDMPGAERAKLLTTTADWFGATVALFLGSDTRDEYDAFVPPPNCRTFHWDDGAWLTSVGPELVPGFEAPLFQTLAANLPLICSVKELTRPGTSQVYQHSRSTGCPIWVYLRKPLDRTEASAVLALAEQYPACVHLRVSLQKGLGTATGFLELRRLLKAGPAIRFTVLAENPWFASAADTMTKLLARGAGKRVQPISARRA